MPNLLEMTPKLLTKKGTKRILNWFQIKPKAALNLI